MSFNTACSVFWRSAVRIGRKSDWPTMKAAAEVCKEFGVEHDVQVMSAHRTPDDVATYAKEAHGQTLRLVVIPHALRVIIPPLTSQYLNLTKNSSLAVAIGYPDFVNVFTGIVLNQTGQAVEVIAMTMGVYLTLSLLTSAFMNWYNRRMALVER